MSSNWKRSVPLARRPYYLLDETHTERPRRRRRKRKLRVMNIDRRVVRTGPHAEGPFGLAAQEFGRILVEVNRDWHRLGEGRNRSEKQYDRRKQPSHGSPSSRLSAGSVG